MRRIRAVIVVVVGFGLFMLYPNATAEQEAARPTTSTSTSTSSTTTTTVPPPTTTTPTTQPVRARSASNASVVAPKIRESAPEVSGDVYDRLAQCESGMTNANTGNGYYGYFQFLPSTWRSMGESGLPTDHSYAVQKAAAIRLIERSGWSQFPSCARKLGMR